MDDERKDWVGAWLLDTDQIIHVRRWRKIWQSCKIIQMWKVTLLKPFFTKKVRKRRLQSLGCLGLGLTDGARTKEAWPLQ